MKSQTVRRSEAIARDKARAKRTDEEQLKLIATRRGESKREAARLEARIAANKPAAKTNAKKPTTASAEKPTKTKAKAKAKKAKAKKAKA